MMIPIVLGDKAKKVEVSIADANIQFLLGRDYLYKWNCRLIFGDNSLIVKQDLVFSVKL